MNTYDPMVLSITFGEDAQNERPQQPDEPAFNIAPANDEQLLAATTEEKST